MNQKEQLVPAAFMGKELPKAYPEQWFPQYEDNIRAVLHVCICNGCEDAKPRIRELAKDFRLSLFYMKNNKTVPISKLLKQ